MIGALTICSHDRPADPPEVALAAALDRWHGAASNATLTALDRAAEACGMDPDYHGQGSVAAWAMRHLAEVQACIAANQAGVG